MLTPYQQELIHREIDGANTPEQSAEVRKLVETHPEAHALMSSLRDLDSLFRQLPEHETPAHVRDDLKHTVLLNLKAPQYERVQGATPSITRWASEQWNGVINFMGEFMLTKKVLIIGTTAVAVIAIIGQAVVGYQPSVFDAGTVGAGDGMSGVQQAGRYKGKIDETVTLSSPEIQALFQDDQVLKLIQSEVFRNTMRNDTFRNLLASDVFAQLMAAPSFQELMRNSSYQQLMADANYQELSRRAEFQALMANANYQAMMADANVRNLFANANYSQLMKNDTYRNLTANETFRNLMANQTFRNLMKNDSYLRLMANDTFRQTMAKDTYLKLAANDTYRVVAANETYLKVMSNDAFRRLEASASFRAISRNSQLADTFLADAMRVARVAP